MAQATVSIEQALMNNPHLHCAQLTVTVNDRVLVRELELDISSGSFVCVLGTNGVGKTLTLQTLAGLREPDQGGVTLCGAKLGALTRREIALRLGMLLQIHEDAFPVTVTEGIMMGRYPHMDVWQWPDERDHAAVSEALSALDLADLGDRRLNELSGGERERAALATLWAQDPAIWLLDEPMNHLDPQHQLQVLSLLKKKAASGRVVVASLHNPAMAMRYANQALLLYGDGQWEYGSAAKLLEPERLQRTYGTPFEYFSNGEQKLLLPA